jgi:WD40 repeat protein/tRNA A-37 threonylcarbamoyl transferase component Bud32
MTPEAESLSGREQRLNEVIAEYLTALAAGQKPDPETLLARHPDLAEDLRAFFTDHDRLWQAAGPNPPVTAPPPATGRVRYFGDYELQEVLGRGGMGVVWKASQVSLKRPVALKMILDGQLAAEADIRRFHAEAENVARLDHPNIVPIYEVGQHQGEHYFSMKLVEGGNLAQARGAGKWPVARPEGRKKAVALMINVARAVDYAHQRGILHRDLKPANILLDAQGEPHVADFGLARRTEAAGLSASGAIVGTPEYMAPEQAAGSRVLTTAADVYGLGAILYELLTGRPPFRGATLLETLTQVQMSEPKRPRASDSNIPRDLETICLKCLEKDPRRRYESARALAEDLQCHLDGKPILARPVGAAERLAKWARRRPAIAALAAALVLAVAVGLVGVAWSYRQAIIERDVAWRTLANSRVQLAHAAWREGDVAMTAEHLAEVPRHLRSWDWQYLKRLSEGSLFTLYGHTHDVESVAFSPDGRLLASGGGGFTSAPGEVKIWDARTGRELLSLHGHTRRVITVAFRPDGECLATGGTDGTIRLWNVRTGECVLTLPVGDRWVESVAFSPDGRLLASASSHLGDKQGDARVWDAHTGRQLLAVWDHAGRVNSVAFSPDSRHLATASNDRTVRVWDAHTGQELLCLRGHEGPVESVAFSPDGAHLASASTVHMDSTVKVWDARTGEAILNLKQPQFPGYGQARVAFSPDGQRLANTYSNLIRVWDVRTSQEVLTLQGHKYNVTCLAFSPDGQRLASGGRDKIVKIWDVRPGAAQTLPGHRCVAFSPDGRYLAGATADHTVSLWDTWTGQQRARFRGHTGIVQCLSFSPDGGRLASGSADKTVKVWDVATGRELLTFRGHSVQVVCVAFHPDGRRLASCANGSVMISSVESRSVGEAKVWDAHTGAELWSPPGPEPYSNYVAISPDGRRLAGMGAEGKVKVWDLGTGQETFSGDFPAPSSFEPTAALAFSPDGTLLAGVNGARQGKVWEVPSGRERFSFRATRAVVFSPDGQRLAAAWQNVIKLWDVGLGQETFTLRGHADEVRQLAFNAAGVLASADGYAYKDGVSVLRLWDGRPGAEKYRFKGKKTRWGSIDRVAFSPDGERLAGVSYDRTVHVWDLATGEELLVFSTWTGAANEERQVIIQVAFSADGGRIITTTQEGGAWVQGLPFGQNVLAWDAHTGRRVSEPVPPGPTFAQPVSPDGRFFAHLTLDGEVSLVDRRQTEEERLRRQQLAASDPVWQEAEGERQAQAGQWFAAAFHFDQAARGQPARVDLRRRLALCQLAAGNPDAYRRTVAALLGHQLAPAEALRASRLILAAGNGLLPLVVAAGQTASERNDLLRVCLLQPLGNMEVESLRPLAFSADTVSRAAFLHCTGRPQQAFELLASPREGLEFLYLALVEQSRGRSAEANQALRAADRWLKSPSLANVRRTNASLLSWEARVELDLLRRELEALLPQPPL